MKKIFKYICVGLVATLPALWIDGYDVHSPVWWTVISAWNLSPLIDEITKENENERNT